MCTAVVATGSVQGGGERTQQNSSGVGKRIRRDGKERVKTS